MKKNRIILLSISLGILTALIGVCIPLIYNVNYSKNDVNVAYLSYIYAVLLVFISFFTVTTFILNFFTSKITIRLSLIFNRVAWILSSLALIPLFMMIYYASSYATVIISIALCTSNWILALFASIYGSKMLKDGQLLKETSNNITTESIQINKPAESSNELTSTYNNLKKIKELYDDGIIDEEEFKRLKDKVIEK